MSSRWRRRVAAVALVASVLAVFVPCAVGAATPPGAGAVAPPFAGTNADAARVSLADYAGKVVVLSFWASWCPPCMRELPVLEGIQRSGGKEQVQVIAINTETPDVYRKISRHLTSLELMLTSDAAKEAETAYGVHGIPHMVIVGRDGRIVRVHRGYQEKELDHIVAEINAALAAR